MTSLFNKIKPSERFRLNARHIAHILKIQRLMIVRIERWAYVLFIHRRDKGGQFISYRQLNRWTRAIAHMIQTSPTLDELWQLGQAIHQETVKFEDRYSAAMLEYWRQLWADRRDKLISLIE